MNAAPILFASYGPVIIMIMIIKGNILVLATIQ